LLKPFADRRHETTQKIMDDDLQKRVSDALQHPSNLGELPGADAVGTAGSADCGDMLRMWVKFRIDEKGRKVIDRATFQTFGCETALAVASVATELIAGRTVDEALAMDGMELSAPLGPLPPMKIHCAQLVEGALRDALTPKAAGEPAAGGDSPAPAPGAKTLIDSFSAPSAASKPVRVVFKQP
jgi:nitrogen fixation NifU-like protein